MPSRSDHALLLAAALFLSCSAAPQPATRRHQLSTFSLEVPSSWKRIDFGPNDTHDAFHAFIGEGARFEGPAGEFVDVYPDLATETSSADNWWMGEARPDGSIRLGGDATICKRPPKPAAPQPAPEEFEGIPEPECTAGDGFLDVWVFFEARGHGYVIIAGNTKREKAEDLAPLRAILETFRAR